MNLTFHRTFSFSRSSVMKVLDIAQKNPGFKQSDLAANTDLGTIYQEAMPRYAKRAGLLDEKNQLTSFGRFVTEFDPYLEKMGTQWLLHYHLSAPHRPTVFWHYLVTRWFIPGNTFTAKQLLEDLMIFLQHNTGKTLSSRSVRSTVTIFIGTYLKSDGLKRLGLIEEFEKDTYRVPQSPRPPTWALGYALADYWQAHYGERLTVNLDDLTGKNFAGLFLLGEEGLTELLIELKQEGMIDLHRIASPYQVVLLQSSLELALERLYK
ncbi:DUF4007 family protein [Thermanaerothrix sp. 4228-RoL]|uniref:DUF4007 family protein n=1 Tax=Thermanaerothrix solaris TaxID=3058434 RepID=A0ABU3NR12_9CHLR|nr:DUF4007 family protein [Thermanaerothrix sp. 4228-RoL]MDT8898281.1 DUF4007 family protein [Thermanaerothrix sp. 4228-RoL]